MPKIDYSKIEIYKISCKDVNVKYVYIGYSTNIYKKRYDHKHNSQLNTSSDFLYSTINSNGGWENWEMSVLEKGKCTNKEEVNILIEKWKKMYRNESIGTTEIAPNQNPLQCQYCLKSFSNKSSITRHSRGRCKQHESLQQQQVIERLEKQLKEKETQLVCVNNKTNNSHNTNTNTINTVINNNNTIRLVGLGNENIVELLSEREKKQILGKMHKSLIHLIEKVHFSGEYPQFANVVITNLKSKLAYKYSEADQKFIVDTAEKVIQEVIDNHFDDICTIYEEQKDSLDKKINIRTGEFIEQHSNNPEKYKQATDDVRLMMYNKREKVDINTQKAINNT